jgi:hypothetical protein
MLLWKLVTAKFGPFCRGNTPAWAIWGDRVVVAVDSLSVKCFGEDWAGANRCKCRCQAFRTHFVSSDANGKT